MPPLPKFQDVVLLLDSSTLCAAYRSVVALESSVLTDLDPRKLIYARLLGYLLLYGPSSCARLSVGREVTSCEDENGLLNAGKTFYDYYIPAFKKTVGFASTHTSNSNSSDQSLEESDDNMSRVLGEIPRSHNEAKRNALMRDGFRCVVTGDYDVYSLEDSSELEKIVCADSQPTATNCVHIFSESTTVNTIISDSWDTHATSLWDIMYRFGYTNIAQELNGLNVHRLENVITMCFDAHSAFNKLKLWFEATDKPNTYELKVASHLYLRRSYKHTITFTTPDEVKYPLPSPEYLAIHASCAKIAHLSGATVYIDKMAMELADISVLDADGKSAEVLDHALSR